MGGEEEEEDEVKGLRVFPGASLWAFVGEPDVIMLSAWRITR